MEDFLIASLSTLRYLSAELLNTKEESGFVGYKDKVFKRCTHIEGLGKLSSYSYIFYFIYKSKKLELLLIYE